MNYVDKSGFTIFQIKVNIGLASLTVFDVNY